MASYNILLDGVDVSTLGLSLIAIPGLWDAPDDEVEALELPEFDGMIETGARPRMSARIVEVEARSVQTDATTAETTMQTLKDALAFRRVKITPGTDTTRSWYGTLSALRAEHEHPKSADGWVRVGRLAFRCADPYMVDNDESNVCGIAGQRVPITLGSGPTLPYVTIVGSTSATVTLTARKANGDSFATMIFSTALAVDDAYVIETVNGGRAWLHDAGVITTAMSLLTAGYAFPAFEPRYGDRALSMWPTLETDKGTLVVRYARRWR
jgi:hypothetical protein